MHHTTPEKPINARAKIPAVISAIGIPRNDSGTSFSSSLSRKPANSTNARATTIGNVEAVRIAVQQGAEIKYDEVAQTPYFNYDMDGTTHEVWFEDVRSLQQKFNLIKEFGLRGPGYWQIMQLFRANWLLLNDNFFIEKEG